MDDPAPSGTTRRVTLVGGLALAVIAAGLVVWALRPPPAVLAAAIPSSDWQLPPAWVDIRLAAIDEPGTLAVAIDGTAWMRTIGALGEEPTPLDGDLNVVFPAAADGLVVNGEAAATAIQIEPGPDGGPLFFDDRAYRGALRILREHDRVLIVNRLPVDHYLLGVVSEEMPTMFGTAALRSQAVAARSWVLARLAEGGVVYDDARSQVYAGIDGETSASHDAVMTTAGLVIVWDGAVAPAWYHSTCGGMSRPAGAVFPAAPEGFLDEPRACSTCRHSPYFSWTRRFDRATTCRAAKLPEAPLQGVTVLATAAGARAQTVKVTAGNRTTNVHAEDLRVNLSRGLRIREQVLSTLWSSPPVVHADELVIQGRGWGHGVGLCQYGAAGLAKRGASYDEILAQYYPGARLMALPLDDAGDGALR